MNIIRRAILALSLLAGIAPAIAQVPPPVSALPDTERRTTYSITASTCACSVGFALYGDSTDVTNWIEVFVNGALIPQSGNWTLTSATGSLGTIPRPITNAVLNFTSAQTGTVQIVGARRPRRTSQFNENRGVAARDLNQVITDMVAMLRENWDKTNDVTGRAVVARPGETLALLPVLANRINQGACFDSSGNLVNCVSIPSSTLIVGAGIALTGVGPTTVSADIAAGANIVITGTHPMVISSNTPGAAALYVRPQDYGAACDGVTDDAVALQSAINASVNKALFIPAGTCLTNSTLNVLSNVTITGAGRDVAILKSAANPAFAILNRSNVSITNIQIQGTNSVTSWALSPTGPISLLQNGSAVSAGSNFNFRNLKFVGWNVTYWMIIGTSGSTFGMSDVIIDNNIWTSAASSVPTDADPFSDTNALIVLGSATAGNGRIENLTITNNQMEATGVCFGILNYANTYKFRIANNNILNPGVTTPGHCTNALGFTNAYGIAVYDLNADGNQATDGLVTGNYILNPRATGIYWVGNGGSFLRASNAARSVISNNIIEGQSNSDAFPRGAIVVNTSTDISVVGNSMYSNQAGIFLNAQSTGDVSVLANHCYTGSGGGSHCLQMSGGANGSSNTDRRIIRGNYFEADIAVEYVSVTGGRFNDVDFSGNTIFGATSSIIMGGNFFTGLSTVNGNTIRSGTLNFSGITGSLSLSSNLGMTFTAATLPATANGSSVFVSDGTPASACTGGSTGSMGFRQNAAWKCF